MNTEIEQIVTDIRLARETALNLHSADWRGQATEEEYEIAHTTLTEAVIRFTSGLDNLGLHWDERMEALKLSTTAQAPVPAQVTSAYEEIRDQASTAHRIIKGASGR